MLVSTESKQIMQNHYKAIGGDLNKSWSARMKAAMPESFKNASIDLINIHLENMSEEELARSKRTLKQLGG